MTLLDWLYSKTEMADILALRDQYFTWDIWELIMFVKHARAIQEFPLGRILNSTHVYEMRLPRSTWLICEEDGRRLYELVAKYR